MGKNPAIMAAAMLIYTAVGVLSAAEPIDVGSRKQLFIDNRFIDSSAGITLTMNPPHKTGERTIVADRP